MYDPFWIVFEVFDMLRVVDMLNELVELSIRLIDHMLVVCEGSVDGRTIIRSAMLAAAIDAITTLLAIFPDAIVGDVVDVTRDFRDLDDDAGILVFGGRPACIVIGTRGTEAVVEATEAILSTGPLRDREMTGLGVVCSSDVVSIVLLIEP